MGARSTLHEAAIGRQDIMDRRDACPAPRIRARALWRQLLGLVAWAGAVSFFVMGPMVATLLVVLGGVALVDLWRSGPSGAVSRSNRRPVALRIGKALLIVVAYPAYLLGVGKLRTIERADDFYWTIVVLGGIAYLWFIALGVAAALAQTAI